ncbi:Permease of the drug/metabolite transporter (DMT) superfamily [Halogranum gelatinilyticum]|uniref:Permease of the drug/metabolite transporter (DMT) superfamily n=1 Tax=Halogranum gelatinilyticum TaxID=660521 RepID=A0A1G9VFH3_9EURY|nr:EamA family transporter [Halogranum gelatinilyticum]SDM70856.1 Permease of the drug/metabolite transporter (DMT) superfamily [Halogranum gelatinilyticum]
MVRRYTFALAPLAAATLWGGMYVVSKWGFGLVPPLTLGFLRVALGAAVLYPLVRRRDVTVEPDDYRGFVLLGGWVTATIATQFVGTELTNASQGSLLTVLTPVCTVLLGVAVLDERLTRGKTVGIALATLGTVVVIVGQYRLSSLATGDLLGVLALVAASVSWAGFTVWGAPYVRRYSAITAVTYSTLASVPMLAVLAGVELAARGIDPTALPVTVESVAAVLYLGIGATAAAWYLWYKGLEYVDAGTVAAFFFAQPVVGSVLGVFLLGEAVGATFGLGGGILAVGVWLVSVTAADRA